ncbi:MAG: hypothetical protein ACR2GU_14010 [Rubrobacteraceae bacterium]
MKPTTLLLVLILAIPLAVTGTGAVSFLLLRAGYGIFVWAVLPFVGLILLTVVIGLVLGRAAGGRRTGPARKNGRRDDV